ncbi:Hypothetical predicted protein [Mytilus galloprovincialis]|uniref:Uncharacterized protein n=1 Tax=Mytilus galloprovincialis TaxID=29158 RepID=A0A8B6HBI5_MYTGA|nr:Hypothetical predicted protein [Mytilus galloprovincialis]
MAVDAQGESAPSVSFSQDIIIALDGYFCWDQEEVVIYKAQADEAAEITESNTVDIGSNNNTTTMKKTERPKPSKEDLNMPTMQNCDS